MSKKSRRKTQEEFKEMVAWLNKQPKFLKLDDPRLVERLPEPLDASMTYTPKEIVEDMLDLLPEEIWSDPNATFLDPVSKSGMFLDRIYFRLFNGLRKEIPNHYDRRRHILTKQIYGLVEDGNCAVATKMLLYGSDIINDSKSYVSGYWEDEEKQGNIKYFSLISDGNDGQVKGKTISRGKLLEDMTKERNIAGSWIRFKKEVLNNMKFDVVIGNPPYNSGMDLDFVNLGFELSKKYCIMITPAKWQNAVTGFNKCVSAINYERFREKIVKYMKRVCFYPCCYDVFGEYDSGGINQADGLTYFMVGKDIVDKCVVENKSVRFDILNSVEKRSIVNQESLLNIGNEIIQYINNSKEYKQFRINKMKVVPHLYNVIGTDMMPGTLNWKRNNINKNKPTYITSNLRVVKKEEYKHRVHHFAIFSSESREECDSYKSYLYTKFVRFLLLCNVMSLTTYTDDCFKFVPAPLSGKFDHIYTDEELYKAFNLPQKYIDVIEAIVKERK